jgi:curli biogenesis system outer membrane secretion channel CsgG
VGDQRYASLRRELLIKQLAQLAEPLDRSAALTPAGRALVRGLITDVESDASTDGGGRFTTAIRR